MEGQARRETKLSHKGGHDLWVVLCIQLGQAIKYSYIEGLTVPKGANLMRPFGPSPECASAVGGNEPISAMFSKKVNDIAQIAEPFKNVVKARNMNVRGF